MAGRRQPYNTEATGLVQTHTSTWAPAATTNSPLRTTPRKCNLISEMKWIYGRLHAVNYAPNAATPSVSAEMPICQRLVVVNLKKQRREP